MEDLLNTTNSAEPKSRREQLEEYKRNKTGSVVSAKSAPISRISRAANSANVPKTPAATIKKNVPSTAPRPTSAPTPVTGRSTVKKGRPSKKENEPAPSTVRKTRGRDELPAAVPVRQSAVRSLRPTSAPAIAASSGDVKATKPRKRKSDEALPNPSKRKRLSGESEPREDMKNAALSLPDESAVSMETTPSELEHTKQELTRLGLENEELSTKYRELEEDNKRASEKAAAFEVSLNELRTTAAQSEALHMKEREELKAHVASLMKDVQYQKALAKDTEAKILAAHGAGVALTESVVAAMSKASGDDEEGDLTKLRGLIQELKHKAMEDDSLIIMLQQGIKDAHDQNETFSGRFKEMCADVEHAQELENDFVFFRILSNCARMTDEIDAAVSVPDSTDTKRRPMLGRPLRPQPRPLTHAITAPTPANTPISDKLETMAAPRFVSNRGRAHQRLTLQGTPICDTPAGAGVRARMTPGLTPLPQPARSGTPQWAGARTPMPTSYGAGYSATPQFTPAPLPEGVELGLQRPFEIPYGYTGQVTVVDTFQRNAEYLLQGAPRVAGGDGADQRVVNAQDLRTLVAQADMRVSEAHALRFSNEVVLQQMQELRAFFTKRLQEEEQNTHLERMESEETTRMFQAQMEQLATTMQSGLERSVARVEALEEENRLLRRQLNATSGDDTTN